MRPGGCAPAWVFPGRLRSGPDLLEMRCASRILERAGACPGAFGEDGGRRRACGPVPVLRGPSPPPRRPIVAYLNEDERRSVLQLPAEMANLARLPQNGGDRGVRLARPPGFQFERRRPAAFPGAGCRGSGVSRPPDTGHGTGRHWFLHRAGIDTRRPKLAGRCPSTWPRMSPGRSTLERAMTIRRSPPGPRSHDRP